MSETYAQRRNAVLKQLGAVKRALNLANGDLEKVRREAVRLSDRKTLITPDQLVNLSKDWSDTLKSYNAASAAIGQLNIVAKSYL